MTRELRNAVSRLRKLQDAAFAGKIALPSVNIGLSTYNHHYESGDHATIDVSVCIHDEYGEMLKYAFFTLSDEWCHKVGDTQSMSIAEVLHEIEIAVNYPI